MTQRNRSTRKPQQITDSERQSAWDELVRILIRGGTQKQAAELLGFHPQTISKWCATEEFKLKLQRTRNAIFNAPQDATVTAVLKDIKDKMEEYAREGLDHEYVLMRTAESEGVQLKAAQDLMDRSPETQKTKNVKVQGSIALFTPADLVLMAQKAKEIQEDMKIGHPVLPVPIDSSMALPIEAEPFED